MWRVLSGQTDRNFHSNSFDRESLVSRSKMNRKFPVDGQEFRNFHQSKQDDSQKSWMNARVPSNIDCIWMKHDKFINQLTHRQSKQATNSEFTEFTNPAYFSTPIRRISSVSVSGDRIASNNSFNIGDLRHDSCKFMNDEHPNRIWNWSKLRIQLTSSYDSFALTCC